MSKLGWVFELFVIALAANFLPTFSKQSLDNLFAFHKTTTPLIIQSDTLQYTLIHTHTH